MKSSICKHVGVGFLCTLLLLNPIQNVAAKGMDYKETTPKLEDYNVVWETPSGNIEGSMPIGNGKNTVLVWVDNNGDLMLRLARGDSWDEYARSVKLGNVRIHFNNSLNQTGKEFKQTLNYYDGEIQIKTPDTLIRIWVDANQDIIHVEAEEEHPGTVEVSVESWRTEDKVINWLDGWHDFMHVAELDNSIGIKSGEIRLTGDEFQNTEDSISWYHRNETAVWSETLENQSITPELIERYDIQDPLLYRTSGGMIKGTDLKAENNSKLVSAEENTKHRIDIATHTEIAEDVNTWKDNIQTLVTENDNSDLEKLREEHQAYWHDYWDRSYIFVTGDEDADKLTKGWIATRWMEACAGRAEGPIEFNGGVFAFEEDELMWHDYTQFNQRFVYWSMMQSGDFDMMQPYFDMNINSMPVAEASAKARWGEDTEGFILPEHMILYGPQTGSHYGWDREGKEPSYVQDDYTRKLYAGSPEIGAMMVTYYEYTLDEEFARNKMIPFCDGVIKWYDTHFGRDEEGKIYLENIYSGEADRNCDNPMSDVAGLHRMTEGLLALPDTITTEDERKYWEKIKDILPDIPVYDGRLQTAENLKAVDSNETNNQNLFAVFPYGYYGNGKDDLEAAVSTYYERRGKCPESGNQAWRHDALQASALGLAEEAADQTLMAFGRDSYRYEGFVDGFPDSASMCIEPMAIGKTALQQMLVYPGKDKSVNLLNAWPLDWDVKFKLYAPGKTTIEGEYNSGELAARISSDKEQSLDISCNMTCNNAEIISGDGEILKDEGIIRLSIMKEETAEIKFSQGTIKEGTYGITYENGRMDIKNGQEGTPVVLKPAFQNDNSQKWNLVSCGIGQFKIKNAETGKALTAADGILVQTFTGDEWWLKESGQGYMLLSKEGNLALGCSKDQFVLCSPDDAVTLGLEQLETLETPEAAGSIKITGESPLHSGDIVQLGADVETGDGIRQDMEMVWSVKNKDGEAAITPGGILTAEKAGTVIVQAYPKEMPASVEEKEIVIEEGIMEQDPLTGEIFGRKDGEWENQSPPEYAFDKDIWTAYDGQDGSYAGMKLEGPFYLEGIRFMGRDGYGDRIIGAQIQGSKDGETWETLCQIESVNENQVYNSITIDDSQSVGAYSYYRIYSGDSQFCNIAEVEFYGHAAEAIDGFNNIRKAADQIIKDNYEAEGVKRLEQKVEAASAVTEESSEAEIIEAKEAIAESIRNLRKPFLLYNYDISAERDGDWKKWEDNKQYSGAELYAEEAGSAFSFSFEGTGFEMLSNKNPGLSSVQIALNGEILPGGEEISLYDSDGNGHQKQSVCLCTGLEYGNYTVTITLLDKINQAGNGPKASLDAFRIFRDYEMPEEPEEPDIPSSADTTALKMAVSMAGEMENQQAESESFTAESWQAVQEALDAARTVLNSAEASQEDADSAFLRLITACNLLEEGVQKTGLRAVIEGTKTILADTDSLKQYTAESVEAVREALLQAENVYENGSFDQGKVNESSINLMTAVTSLMVQDEMTGLGILIQKVEELLAREEQYTLSSVQKLRAALENAEMVDENSQSTLEQIEEAYISLAQAMTGLVRRADKSELESAIAKGKEILAHADRYAQATLENLPSVMEEAQTVYDNSEADSQEVGEILKKLVGEILRARILGDVDGNGIVGTEDAAAILSWQADLSQLTEEGLEAADVNYDTVTDSSDAARIMQYAVEKILEF